MPRKLGRFPDRRRVAELGRYYEIMGNKIKDELMTLDAADFSEISAASVQQNVRNMTRQMNRQAVKWSRMVMPETYKQTARIAQVSLDILGAVKDNNYDEKIHYRTIEQQQEITENDLIKANLSINQNVGTYIHLLRMSKNSLMQIQAFDLRDEEIVSELLDDAIKAGQSRGKLAQLIRVHFKRELWERKFMNINGRNYNLIKYAKMVAQTRMRIIQTKSTLNMCNQYANDLVEVSDHSTDCEICQDYEGNIYSIGGKTPDYPYLAGNEPPYHPRCVLPDTRCVAPGGLVAGIRAHYDGQVVELTFAERGSLSITINHLFLTPRGFVPAHLLRKGDDIFYCSDFEGIITSNPYNNGTPSCIEDIISALSESSGMMTRSMPLSPEDLHNDGQFCNGNVHIIRPNGFLRDASKALIFEKGKTILLNPGDPRAFSFFGESDLATMFKTLAFTADSIMGGQRLPSPFLSAHPGRHNEFDITSGSRSNSGIYNDTPNYHPMNIELFGNVNKKGSALIEPDGLIGAESLSSNTGNLHAFTRASSRQSGPDESSPNSFIAYSKSLCDIINRKPGLIKRIKLTGVNIFPYSGHVYDLHTSSSLYLANGLLSSNCQHNIGPTSVEAIEVREVLGYA